jgi:lauroyl/myristoyl acyltransferase
MRLEADKRGGWRAAGGSVLRRCRGAVKQTGDLVRVAMLALLRPAAIYLPRRWALALADLAGWAFHVTLIGARVRRSMRAAFPGRDAGALALEWLRGPFRDYVVATQIKSGRERPSQWQIEHRNFPDLLRDPIASAIIATGHFSRQSMSGLYLQSIVPQKLTTVIAPIDRTSRNARALRLRLLMGGMVDAIKRIRGDIEVAEIGSLSVIAQLVRNLRAPGHVVIIAADGAWQRDKASGYERAFAGHAKRNVALGTARLARISQRPIVTCVTYVEADGRIVMDWGAPIAPADKADAAADVRVTDLMLDVFERAVGARPGQYVLPIGEERRWSEAAQCWMDARPVVAQASAAPSRIAEPA